MALPNVMGYLFFAMSHFCLASDMHIAFAYQRAFSNVFLLKQKMANRFVYLTSLLKLDGKVWANKADGFQKPMRFWSTNQNLFPLKNGRKISSPVYGRSEQIRMFADNDTLLHIPH